MFTSWTGWWLRYERTTRLGAYLVGVIVALVLGATGMYIALIGLLVATAAMVALEGWTRYRHEPSVADEPSRYPTGHH
jgi:hypothetical protein